MWLTDVALGGWRVCYSQSFLSSMSDEERVYIMGTEPVRFMAKDRGTSKDSAKDSLASSEPASDDDEARDQSKPGWDGAVVAVLGLFDKGKTFVLNHLTDSKLPSGKKVAAARAPPRSSWQPIRARRARHRKAAASTGSQSAAEPGHHR